VNKLTIKDVELKDKRVLIRVDFNVPLNKETGEVADNTRITSALPTIEYVIKKGGKVVLFSHLGRPKGTKDLKYSMKNVAKRLEELMGKEIKFCNEPYGELAEKMISEMLPGEILLLENTRFDAGEEKNNPELALKYSKLGDIHVNDAFS